jgi:hypothetical protein
VHHKNVSFSSHIVQSPIRPPNQRPQESFPGAYNHFLYVKNSCFFVLMKVVNFEHLKGQSHKKVGYLRVWGVNLGAKNS